MELVHGNLRCSWRAPVVQCFHQNFPRHCSVTGAFSRQDSQHCHFHFATLSLVGVGSITLNPTSIWNKCFDNAESYQLYTSVALTPFSGSFIVLKRDP